MHISNRFKLWAMAVSIAGVAAVAACQETGPTEHLTPVESTAAVAQAARVVVTPDTLKLNPVGTKGTMTGRAYSSAGAELSGVPLKWWLNASSYVTADSSICKSPCTVTFTSNAAGTTKVITKEYGGTAADTVWVVVSGSGPPPPPPTLKAIGLTPASVTLDTSASQQFTAHDTMSDGTIKTFAGTWSATGGTITSAGLYKAGKVNGSFRVIAAESGKSDTATVTVQANSPPPPPPPGGVVVLAAGDIAGCNYATDEATAKLLDGQAGTVLLLGDNAYENGSTADYANCYQPTWGRHKARTRPSPGNHDYHTSGASAYYAYFGASAGPAGRGYYSFDLGAWHLISLNSNRAMSASSAQGQWLQADLAGTSKRCILAYWHHPRFSSSSKHGNNPLSGPIWNMLYAAKAELVLVGHDHTYERFAPQTPAQVANPNGIREFVVGTGGRSLYGFGTPQPNSQVRHNQTHGVLKLVLGDGKYSWQFLPVAGKTFTDTGNGVCTP